MKKWLKEAEESLEEALIAIADGSIPPENMYMLASVFYSKRQNTNNSELLEEMYEAAEEQVQHDWSCDEKSKYQYKFHFVSAYMYCFVVAGKVDEFKHDQIMEYVCGQMNLFTEDYSN